MTRIGLVSDTHGHVDKQLEDFFKDCDEIWHAGDIGTIETLQKIAGNRPVRAVYGNIDGQDIRVTYKEHERFFCEDVDVWITHIGGYPKRYDARLRTVIRRNPPKLFISGHSHILKVIYDNQLGLLHINPGAYGKSGFHKVRTAVRFAVRTNEVIDLQILEIQR